MGNPILTVGHSNHEWSRLTDMLTSHQVELLVDVRAFPRSARNPQFSGQHMSAALQREGIDYRWAGKQLGGFRKASPKSMHRSLKMDAFRGYAEHMSTEPFAETLDELIALIGSTQIAIMCAEADFRHCHRQFIADYMLMRGVAVSHITADAGLSAHSLSENARMVDGQLVYDLNSQQQLDF